MDKQVSLVATSADGIKFAPQKEILGDSYFRVFQWGGYHYAMARLGALFRSRDGLTGFEQGPNPFSTSNEPSRVRHTAVMIEGKTLLVFYSRIGDSPERILLSKIDLTKDWKEWKATEPMAVLEPEMQYEGAHLPLEPSKVGDIKVPVRQLRDPAIFREGRKTYLLYSVAGEQGIGIAEILWEAGK
jgi:hypothetical protein